ncbi:hypothetical protein INT44_008026 [Umbelopsis vinacea]|uniref:Retrotransposon gag domain-containing protein n=1 Tax=Umbelopsis vinacea TaxID=44442 RepID=A0A8H7UC57_9FUNG|nr:hypothetical protein INT44_008026 [Umbelopsis vinacea]
MALFPSARGIAASWWASVEDGVTIWTQFKDQFKERFASESLVEGWRTNYTMDQLCAGNPKSWNQAMEAASATNSMQQRYNIMEEPMKMHTFDHRKEVGPLVTSDRTKSDVTSLSGLAKQFETPHRELTIWYGRTRANGGSGDRVSLRMETIDPGTKMDQSTM